MAGWQGNLQHYFLMTEGNDPNNNCSIVIIKKKTNKNKQTVTNYDNVIPFQKTKSKLQKKKKIENLY